MKIITVDMKDVRQFLGEQRIQFAVEPEEMITLIHGPNTTGKTTLLNAIFWCFYGKFLAGFSEAERLRSAESANDEYFVEVAFEHRGRRYVARRVSRGQPSDSRLTVLEIRKSGQAVPHPQPDLLIGSILPEALAHFFFFAGEMMQKQLSAGTYQQTATDAIRAVLGLKLAEQTRDDLREIRKKRRRSLELLSKGTDLERVTTQLEAAESFIESRSEQLIQVRAAAAGMESDIRQINDQLRGMESSASLQSRMDTVAANLRRAQEAFARATAARQELIAKYGAALYFNEAASGALSLINDAITKKRIPSPFDKPFVEDILKSELCICHRKVTPGSNEYRAVSTLLNDATDSTSYQRALAIRGVGDLVRHEFDGAGRAFTRAFEQWEDARDAVERLEQDEARIKDLFRRHSENNVRELERQRDNLERKLRDMLANKQVTERDIEERKRERDELKKEQERAKAASPQVARAKGCVEVVEALIDRLEAELERVEAQGRERIRDALNDVVSRSTREKYSADITPDYLIRLFRAHESNEERPVLVLSSGERRLLDLCFVAALVAVCRERESEGNAILLPGAVAPLIVDAPFGELDPEYQALAAQTMSSLTDQLVLLLSKTHWTKEVDQAIRSKIGREYLLVGHRAGAAGEAAPVEIVIEGHKYQQMIYGSANSWTEIQPIGAAQ